MSESIGPSPVQSVTARQPHSGHTPPTSPIDSIHHALLDLQNEPSSSASAYTRNFPLTDPASIEPPPLVLDSPRSPGLVSGWPFSWSSTTGKGKGKERLKALGEGHGRSISREELSGGRKGKKRSLSDRITDASGEMMGVVKRRMSGVGGVRVDHNDGDDQEKDGKGGRMAEVRKLVGVRLRLAMQRGNLPFVIVFMICLIMFLSALAGIGYVPPPDSESLALKNAASTFKFGQPIHEGLSDLKGQQIMAARRKMEEAWAKNKRPADGAWMKKQRDDGAVRRKAKSNDKDKGKAKEKAETKPLSIDPKIREEENQDE